MNEASPAGQVASQGYMARETLDDEIDLRDLIGALSEGRVLLLAITLAMVLGGLFYVWAAPREYESDAMVQVELQSSSSLDAALGELNSVLGGDTTEVAAEIELLKSRMLVGRVVDALREYIFAEPQYFPVIGRALARSYSADNPGDTRKPLFGLGRFAWGGERIVVSSMEVGRQLLGEELTLVAREGGAYTVEGPEGEPLVTDGRVGKLAQESTSHGPVILFVRELVARPGTRFTVIRRDRDRVIAALREEISVSEKGRDSGILSVVAPGDTPQQAANRVNELVSAYQRQNVERKSQEAQQTLDFLNKQLPQLKAELEAAEARLNQYRLREGSADLTKETELVLQQSVSLEQNIMELQQKRQEAMQRYKATHPVVQTIDAQIAEIQEARSEITDQVKRLPETQQELLRLTRDVTVSTELYTSLLNSVQELQIARAGTIGNVRIVDLGVVPHEPSKPRGPLVVALSLVLGFMLGVMAVFLRRALHSGVENPSEVEREFSLPTYAAVPFSFKQKKIDFRRRRRSNAGTSMALLAWEDPTDVTIESLRSLRTSLHFALLEARNRIIVITGPSPGLGKSFLSLNFSAILAEAGKRVAVVDADLRRGHMHETLGQPRAPGVSDYVAGDVELADIVRPVGPENRVSFIATGVIAPNPAELLLSERFDRLLSSLDEEYDYVIVDTPPILAVTDAAIVGKLAGATLMVLKEGEHPMNMIADALNRLRQGGATVRGTVFNQMGRRAGRYAYSSRYGYRYGYTYKYASSK